MAVLVLDGWNPTSNLEEYAPWVVIVPQDEPIESFDFRCLSGLFAFVLADGIRRMDEIALRVLEFRPVGVFGWTDELGSLAFYVQGAT